MGVLFAISCIFGLDFGAVYHIIYFVPACIEVGKMINLSILITGAPICGVLRNTPVKPVLSANTHFRYLEDKQHTQGYVAMLLYHSCQNPTLTQLNSKQLGLRLATVVTMSPHHGTYPQKVSTTFRVATGLKFGTD